MRKHIRHVLLIKRQIRRRVGEHRLLTEIIANHLRHEIIDALVVRNTVSGRIEQRDIPFSVRVKNMRYANHRLRVKVHRVEVLVGNPAVHRPDTLLFPLVIHVEKPVILHRQLTAVDQVRPRLFRKIRMLKIGSIVASRRQNHRMPLDIDRVHRPPQELCVIPVVLKLVVAECFRAAAPAQLPRNHRIRCTGRHPQIILQDIPLPVLALHKVDSRNMGINPFDRGHALTRRHITTRRKNEILGYHLIPHDFFIMVNIIEKDVERHDTLL